MEYRPAKYSFASAYSSREEDGSTPRATYDGWSCCEPNHMPGFVTGGRYTDRNYHQSNASGETRTTPMETFVAAAIYHGRTLAVTETNY